MPSVHSFRCPYCKKEFRDITDVTTENFSGVVFEHLIAVRKYKNNKYGFFIVSSAGGGVISPFFDTREECLNALKREIEKLED